MGKKILVRVIIPMLIYIAFGMSLGVIAVLNDYLPGEWSIFKQIEGAVDSRPDVVATVYNDILANDTDYDVSKNWMRIPDDKKNIYYHRKLTCDDYKGTVSQSAALAKYLKEHKQDCVIITVSTKLKTANGMPAKRLIIFATSTATDETYLNEKCD